MSPKVGEASAQLGHRIREVRKACGFTQEALADRAGLDAKHVQALEAGGENPTLATLIALADALNVSLSELLKGV